jgi:heme-degrading monooxygenase HmoA
MGQAVELFREEVLPELQRLEGFEGTYVLINPEGNALLVTFWATEEAAGAQIEAGFYGEQLRRYAAIFRSPPGRASYSVVFAEEPARVET